MKKTLNFTKVAKLLGVSKMTLHRMITDGRFPVKPISGTKPRRWSSEAVEAWLRA
jgi:excisionase family DNA binding protein